ncbi:MAG: S8 family serine peptidase [Bacteroidetes bacterium]|nr:S8 family serine peptidase [Bacteroidota bacterium]
MNSFANIISCIIISLIVYSSGYSQDRHWVFFTDKSGSEFDPFSYFDQKAVERRIRQQLPLEDSADYPVSRQYIKEVSILVDAVTTETRWFNGIAVIASEEQLEKVGQLPYVRNIQPVFVQTYPAGDGYKTEMTEKLEDLLKRQTGRMGASLFTGNGIDGKGIRIAIFDGGFPSVDTSPVFEHIRNDGRIIKTWDFTRKNEDVYKAVSHGTMVMSCIAGIVDGVKIGLATGAEFLLARTEIMTEPFSEEENWLAAVEWADKNGADIINSSLGYTFHRYFPWQMDGTTSLVARAANMAASRGILVVNAMGNDGAQKWQIAGTPADADSVLSVGGIDPDLDYHTSFSSFGPTSDKRMKPNVCAFGHVAAAGKKGIVKTQGTSFASPLVAGFAACAWQADRNLTNMQLLKEIEKSGDLYPYYDYAHGYGVPQAAYFTKNKAASVAVSFTIITDTEYLYVMVSDKGVPGSGRYLYYHIENEEGVIDYYAVIEVYREEVLKIRLDEYSAGHTLKVHYKGYTESYNF